MDQFQRVIVKGKSAAQEYVPLTPLDIYLGHYITGGAYFFLRAPDVERLKSALAVALDRHPTFGASMVREASGIGLSCGSTGAELQIHRIDMSCPDLRSGESLVTETLLTETALLEASISDDSTPSSTRSYCFNSGRPVASFRLILFNDDCCALVIRHVHSQADGTGAVHFLQNWSRAYRGLPLSLPSGYTRMHVAGLATLPGFIPSSRLNIRQRDLIRNQTENTPDNIDRSEPAPNEQPIRNSGAIRLDIPAAALESFIHNCRRGCRLSLTSSDILHALVWQSFAVAQLDQRVEIRQSVEAASCVDAEQHFTEGGHTVKQYPRLRLYTLFDLRNIKPLGIPRDYDGSAVLGRCAETDTTQVLNSTIPALALAVQRQLKPFTAEDAHTDISYLAREYSQGYLDDDGNYANFVIAAWLECRNASGLIVNDLRRLVAADICFEECPARMETLVSPDINMVSIYQNDDGTVTLHYVGEQHTLSGFCERVKAVVAHGAHPELHG